jgi:DNA polymerase-3 subunit delta'
MLTLLSRKRGIDPIELHAFADRLARGEADDAYRAVEDLLGLLLAGMALAETGSTAGAESLPGAAPVLRRLGGRAPAARWADLRSEIRESFARTDALNLDRKQTILGAFFAIEAAAR